METEYNMRSPENQIFLFAKMCSGLYISRRKKECIVVFTGDIMVYFHAFAGLVVFSFLAWQLVWPMRKYKAAAGTLLVLLALGAFKFPLIRILGGNRFFAPDLPGWVLHLGGFFYGWILFSFAALIPAVLFFSVFPLFVLTFPPKML